MKYEFKIEVDGGAAFNDTRVITKEADTYEAAEDAAFRDLREEYAGRVALFHVKGYRRV